MAKDIVIVVLILQVAALSGIIFKNIKYMKKLQNASKELAEKIEGINMDKVTKEVIGEVRRQMFNLSLIGIKVK
jgi:hypothetical protein